jgi:hypothetical protein
MANNQRSKVRYTVIETSWLTDKETAQLVQDIADLVDTRTGWWNIASSLGDRVLRYMKPTWTSTKNKEHEVATQLGAAIDAATV